MNGIEPADAAHACPLSLAAVLLVTGLTAAPAQAQVDPIQADRPGFGTSTATVAPGVVQVEWGLPAVAFEGRSALGADLNLWLINFPLLARVGVTSGLELRLASTVYNIADVQISGQEDLTVQGGDEGFGGLEVAAKLRLTRGGGAVPALALVPVVTLPVGDGRFAEDRFGYAAELPAAWTLSDRASLSVMPSVQFDPVSGLDDFITTLALTGTVSRQFNPQLGSYVEGRLFSVDGDAGGYVGLGVLYLPAPDVQLDVFADRGLGEEADDWLFGAGLSVRIGA